jgi:hypothetical protein
MNKIMILMSLLLGGAYTWSQADNKDGRFEFNKYSVVYGVQGDTSKQKVDTTGQAGDGSGNMDSVAIQNSDSANGMYYGYYHQQGQYGTQAEEHAAGTRKPNTYPSGTTGGQVIPVWRPGDSTSSPNGTIYH